MKKKKKMAVGLSLWKRKKKEKVCLVWLYTDSGPLYEGSNYQNVIENWVMETENT